MAGRKEYQISLRWPTIVCLAGLLTVGASLLWLERGSVYRFACLPQESRSAQIALEVATTYEEARQVVYASRSCGEFNDGSTERQTEFLRTLLGIDFVFAVFSAAFLALFIFDFDKHLRRAAMILGLLQCLADWLGNVALWHRADLSMPWTTLVVGCAALKFLALAMLLFIAGKLLFVHQKAADEIAWQRPTGISPQVSGILGLVLMGAAVSSFLGVVGVLTKYAGVWEGSSMFIKLSKRFLGPGNFEFAGIWYGTLALAMLWSAACALISVKKGTEGEA